MSHFQYEVTEYLRLPDDPGVYRFFDKEGKIIYVGKAKSLKKRVSSYFTQINQHNRKTHKLVTEVQFIQFTIVDSEFDALLLENNLIKENQPKYNILLKDDKTYPYIVITKEAFPRIYSTRKVDTKIGHYFGPYSSVKAMKAVLELIRKIYHVRTCTLQLNSKTISDGKFKVCLEYHIGNCLGPCENKQSQQEYQEEIEQARLILKGQISAIKSLYKSKMMEASERMEFEKAQYWKERYELLEKFQIKSTIVNPNLGDLDVFTILKSESRSYINFIQIEEGRIRNTETVEVVSRMDETEKEIMEYVIPTIRIKYQSTSSQIISNTECDLSIDVSIPQIGDKKKLIDLSLKNAQQFKDEKEIGVNERLNKQNQILVQLKQDLRLKEIPDHIECFDNSNIQGTNPVAAMVCFRHGKPAKKDYRHYNIKTVTGPDDFSSMKEVVGRRYQRLLLEKADLPKLIIIDGGKGQLNAARQALEELNIYGKMGLVGVAKRLEEIYYPEDEMPLLISKKSTSLKLIQQIRDETHRFAITFHRKKRSKSAIHSKLDQIKGLDTESKKILLNHFKTTQKIMKASLIELENILGSRKAKVIFNSIEQKKGA